MGPSTYEVANAKSGFLYDCEREYEQLFLNLTDCRYLELLHFETFILKLTN